VGFLGAAAAGAAAAAGTVVTLFLLPLLVTMMNVNSMVEMNEVWLHGHVNSMAAMELGGVFEGGLK
jgi:hypothetical protein